MKKVFFTICLLSIGIAQVRISVSLNKDQILIGDRVVYQVEIQFPESLKIYMPKAGTNLGAFEIKDYNVYDPSKNKGVVSQKFEYLISTFTVGNYVIPPIGIIAVHPSGKMDTLLTPPLTLTVKSLIEGASLDTLDIKDIKHPLPLPFPWKKYAFIGVILIFLLLAWQTYRFWRKRKSAGLGFFEFISPPKSPWELAFEKLDNLERQNLLEQNEFKEYYDKLTDILREYLEGRFDIPALELSTTETLENIHNITLDSENISHEVFSMSVEGLLRRADMAKFAKWFPDRKSADEDFGKVREIIQRTIPKPIVEEGSQSTEIGGR